MSQVFNETGAEEERFNFQQWIIDNKLFTLKNLFIKHGATNATTLQISSPEMQRLMVDPDFLAQPQMVPKIVMATHHLDVFNKIVTVVLSEREQAVMNRIKRELEAVDQMKNEATRLKTEYPKRRKQFENIKRIRIVAVTAQINQTFDALFAALSKRKGDLLQQLHRIEIRYDDDEKDTEMSHCAKNIDHLRSFLKQKEKQYHALISVSKNSAERQSEILQIGKDVDIEVYSMKKDIGDSTKSVREQMYKNSASGFVMDFMKSTETYDRILSDIGQLGDIAATSHSDIRTEEDNQLDSFEIVALYRWETDVTGNARWKNRASNTTIDFWRQPNKGKVRVICRESLTNRLILNHWLPEWRIANVQLRADKFVHWSGLDSTIRAGDKNGFSSFNCEFRNGETAKKFYGLLMESIENNEKLARQQLSANRSKSSRTASQDFFGITRTKRTIFKAKRTLSNAETTSLHFISNMPYVRRFDLK